MLKDQQSISANFHDNFTEVFEQIYNQHFEEFEQLKKKASMSFRKIMDRALKLQDTYEDEVEQINQEIKEKSNVFIKLLQTTEQSCSQLLEKILACPDNHKNSLTERATKKLKEQLNNLYEQKIYINRNINSLYKKLEEAKEHCIYGQENILILQRIKTGLQYKVINLMQEAQEFDERLVLTHSKPAHAVTALLDLNIVMRMQSAVNQFEEDSFNEEKRLKKLLDNDICFAKNEYSSFLSEISRKVSDMLKYCYEEIQNIENETQELLAAENISHAEQSDNSGDVRTLLFMSSNQDSVKFGFHVENEGTEDEIKYSPSVPPDITLLTLTR